MERVQTVKRVLKNEIFVARKTLLLSFFHQCDCLQLETCFISLTNGAEEVCKANFIHLCGAPDLEVEVWVLPVWQFSIFLSLLLDFLYLSAVPSLMTYSSCEEVSELATCLNINIFRPIAFLWNPKFLDYKILINIQVISHELLE